MKEVDIVPANERGEFEVRSRDSFNGYEYEGDPLFGPASEGDCWDWCEERRYSHRRRRLAALVPPKYIKDVEARADKAMERIHDAGLRVESSVTYRASAAWKDEPTHYAYFGDMGGCAQIVWRDDVKDRSDKKWDEAFAWKRELFGMAVALWELGFTLTFHEDGKHRIFGAVPDWVTLDEES